MEALSDNALMPKVRDGDLDKLSLLFMRYKRPLFTFFLTLVRDRELGEDLVQNTFLRIMKYRHLFRGDGDFKTWMFHIARNVKNDQFRKKQIEQKDQVEKWEGKIGHNENRDTEWMLESEHQMLSSALDRLPEEKREILMLSKYQDRNGLATLDALVGYTQDPAVRMQLVKSISFQDSPLVQIALAELMVALNEKSSVSELKKVMEGKTTPKEVKEKLRESVNVLI